MNKWAENLNKLFFQRKHADVLCHPQKTKNRTNIQSRNSTSGYLSKEKESANSMR